jgi:KipI family sensor histidine kinase inhibitor
MRILPSGEHAVLIELEDLSQARAVAESLRRHPIDGVREFVPAARTVLIIAEAGARLADIAAHLGGRELTAWTPDGSAEEIEIPVRYDGPDLADVAELTGLDEADVIAAHTGQVWKVAFCGFLPGFGYLVGESDALRVPRRPSPRTAVPRGAVGLAEEFTGAYPRRSPGGWQLIGTTDAVLWDAHREPAALLRPGVRVRFLETSA